MLHLTDNNHRIYLKIISLLIAFIFSFESMGYCLRVPMGDNKRVYGAIEKTKNQRGINNLFTDNGFMNIPALRYILKRIDISQEKVIKPTIIGSAVYLSNEDDFVDLALIGDIDIAFETEGSMAIGAYRKVFAEKLHREIIAVIGRDNVEEIDIWYIDWDHQIDEFACYQFNIKSPSGEKILITITTMVGNDLAEYIIQRNIKDILTKGPTDDLGRFPGWGRYGKAIKRYMLVLFCLGDKNEFNNFKEKFRQIIYNYPTDPDRESMLAELFEEIEAAVKARKNEYLAKIDNDASKGPVLKRQLRNALEGVKEQGFSTFGNMLHGKRGIDGNI